MHVECCSCPPSLSRNSSFWGCYLVQCNITTTYTGLHFGKSGRSMSRPEPMSTNCSGGPNMSYRQPRCMPLPPSCDWRSGMRSMLAGAQYDGSKSTEVTHYHLPIRVSDSDGGADDNWNHLPSAASALCFRMCAHICPTRCMCN